MLTDVNILTGQSRYDVFELWQESLCRAFGQLGIRANVISGAQDALIPPAPGCISIGFNLVRNWCTNNRDKRHCAWLVDHPGFHAAFFDPSLIQRSFPVSHDQCMLGLVDSRWVEFAKTFYAFPDAFFLPHAGIAKPKDTEQWVNREFEMVFFGTVDHPDRRRESILKQAGMLKPALEVMLDNYSIDSGQSLDAFFLDLLRQCRLPDQTLRLAFNNFLPQLTLYFLHAGQRIRILRGIRRHEVHVFGAGPWTELDLPANIITHPPVTYRETISIMRNTRVLLNHSPLMFWGGHERVCDALLCGCRVLSSFSHFIREEFGENDGTVFYNSDTEMDSLLEQLLADTDAPARIATTQQTVEEKHLMINRAAAIRDYAQSRWPEL